jgi:hypothetical protein
MELKPLKKETIDHLLRQGFPTFGDVFVRQVINRLNEIRPLKSCKKHPIPSKTDLAKMKYSYLKQVISGQKIEVVVGKQKIEKLLLEEKMLTLSKSKGQGHTKEFKVTDLGRRYFENRERDQVKK